MSKAFEEPDFLDGNLEFRIEDGEVCIYGNSAGLKWLAQKCLALVDSEKKNHLHFGDYQMLTNKSEQAVLGLFPKKELPHGLCE